jgi:hypothetical protein
MTLRESSDGDVKVIAVFRSDVFDEINGFAETAFRWGPFGLAIRRITTKSEDVLATVFLGDLSYSKSYT